MVSMKSFKRMVGQNNTKSAPPTSPISDKGPPKHHTSNPPPQEQSSGKTEVTQQPQELKSPLPPQYPQKDENSDQVKGLAPPASSSDPAWKKRSVLKLRPRRTKTMDTNNETDGAGEGGPLWRGILGKRREKKVSEPSPRSTTVHLPTIGGYEDSDLDISYGDNPDPIMRDISGSSSIALGQDRPQIEIARDHDGNTLFYEPSNTSSPQKHMSAIHEHESPAGSSYYTAYTGPDRTELSTTPEWRSPAPGTSVATPNLAPCSFDVTDGSWDMFDGEDEDHNKSYQSTPKKSLWKTFDRLQSPSDPKVTKSKSTYESQSLQEYMQRQHKQQNCVNPSPEDEAGQEVDEYDDNYMLKGLEHLQLQDETSSQDTGIAPSEERGRNSDNEKHPHQVIYHSSNSETLLSPDFTARGHEERDRGPESSGHTRSQETSSMRHRSGRQSGTSEGKPLNSTSTSGGIFRVPSHLSIEEVAAAAGIELSRTEYSSSSLGDSHGNDGTSSEESTYSSSSSSYLNRLEPQPFPGRDPYDFGIRPPGILFSKSDGYFASQLQREKQETRNFRGTQRLDTFTPAEISEYDQKLLDNVGIKSASNIPPVLDHNHPEADRLSDSALDDLEKIRSQLLQGSSPKPSHRARNSDYNVTGIIGLGRGNVEVHTSRATRNHPLDTSNEMGSHSNSIDGAGQEDNDITPEYHGGLEKPELFIPYSSSQSATAAIFRDMADLEPELQPTVTADRGMPTMLAQDLFARGVRDSFADDGGYVNHLGLPNTPPPENLSAVPAVGHGITDTKGGDTLDRTEAGVYQEAQQEDLEGVAIPAEGIGYNDQFWLGAPAGTLGEEILSQNSPDRSQSKTRSDVFRQVAYSKNQSQTENGKELEEAPSLEYSSQDNGAPESITKLVGKQVQYDAPAKGIFPILTAPTTDTWETASDGHSQTEQKMITPRVGSASNVLDFSPVPDEEGAEKRILNATNDGDILLTGDDDSHVDDNENAAKQKKESLKGKTRRFKEWTENMLNASQTSLSWASSFGGDHLPIPAYNNHLAPLTPTPTPSDNGQHGSSSTKSPLLGATKLLNQAMIPDTSVSLGKVPKEKHHRRSQELTRSSFHLNDSDKDDDAATNEKVIGDTVADNTITVGLGEPSTLGGIATPPSVVAKGTKHSRTNTAFSFTTEFLRDADVPLFIYIPLELQQAQQEQIRQMIARKYPRDGASQNLLQGRTSKRISSITVTGSAESDALRRRRGSSHSPRKNIVQDDRAQQNVLMSPGARSLPVNLRIASVKSDDAEGLEDRYADPFGQYYGHRGAKPMSRDQSIESESQIYEENSANDTHFIENEGSAQYDNEGNEDEEDENYDDDDSMEDDDDDDDDEGVEEEGPHLLFRSSQAEDEDELNVFHDEDDDESEEAPVIRPPHFRTPNSYQNSGKKKPVYLQPSHRNFTY